MMRLRLEAIHPSGFPVTLEFEPYEEAKLDAVIERLVSQGYRAPASQPATPPADQSPRCPVHGDLKPSTKEPGTYFCPGRRDDGGFCQTRWPPRAAKSAAR